MPRIPEETVEQVLAGCDIVEVISGYFPLKRAGAVFKALCPFHNEKTPSFTVNPARQRYKCFGCGEGGSAIGFVMRYENLPFPDAVRKLARRANIPVEEKTLDPEADRARRSRTRLLELHNRAARFMHRLLREDPGARHAREYLEGRGYDLDMAERWLVGWMPDKPSIFFDWARAKGFTGRELKNSGLASLREEGDPKSGLYLRFRDRLMFPIHNDYGDIIAFSGRQLRDDPRSGKYINSPETVLFRKSSVFFGLDKARRAMAKEKFALLCEGQIDVIACHEAAFRNAVASLGTAFTAAHARLLKRYTNTAIVCFDSDAAGEKATVAAFRELAAAGLNVRVAALPPGQDPNSLIKSSGPDAFRRLLDQAAEFFDHRIDREQHSRDFSQPAQLAESGRNLAELVAVISDQVAKDAVINHVAVRLGIGTAEFRGAVNDAERRPRHHYDHDGERSAAAEPAAVDRPVLLLCQLALQSHPVLDWLCEQTENLLDAIRGRPGENLLRHILSKRPDPDHTPAVNAFLAALPPADQGALLPHLDEPLPEDPLAAAAETLGFMSQQNLQRRVEAKLAALSRADLCPAELRELQEEILDLQKLLKNSPAHFRS